MTDARKYPHFRADLVGHLLTNDATPSQVAEWLAKDGRARLEEIGNLRCSSGWHEANRRIVGERHANDWRASDRIWTPDGYVRRDAYDAAVVALQNRTSAPRMPAAGPADGA